MSHFTNEQIAKLARLAHLTLDAEKIGNHMNKLNNILGMLEQLREIKTEGIEPLYNVSYVEDIGLITRSDMAEATPGVETILQNAAQSSCGHFSVPKVLG